MVPQVAVAAERITRTNMAVVTNVLQRSRLGIQTGARLIKRPRKVSTICAPNWLQWKAMAMACHREAYHRLRLVLSLTEWRP